MHKTQRVSFKVFFTHTHLPPLLSASSHHITPNTSSNISFCASVYHICTRVCLCVCLFVLMCVSPFWCRRVPCCCMERSPHISALPRNACAACASFSECDFEVFMSVYVCVFQFALNVSSFVVCVCCSYIVVVKWVAACVCVLFCGLWHWKTTEVTNKHDHNLSNINAHLANDNISAHTFAKQHLHTRAAHVRSSGLHTLNKTYIC